MKHYHLLLLCCLATLISSAQQNLYITHATWLNIHSKRLIPDQTVEIRADSIVSVSSRIPPPGASIIDAKGKFLMPGMVDAHVHFFQSGGMYTRPDVIDLRKGHPYPKEIQWTHDHMEDQLRRYLQQGITSVVDVGTSEHFLQQRQDLKGSPVAPTVYMAGPLITDEMPYGFDSLGLDAPFVLVKTPQEARAAVDAQLEFHPDLIKIWYLVYHTKAEDFYPCVQAAIEEAHSRHLKVAVHATELNTARLAVQAGADYLVHSIEDTLIGNDFVNLLNQHKTILCPTLTIEDGYENTFRQTLPITSKDLLDSDPFVLASLIDFPYQADTAQVNRYKKYADRQTSPTAHRDSIRMVNLKKLQDGGVTIIAGTDAGNIGTLHATSYLQELKTMQQSGLSTWQVLQAATINPAHVLGEGSPSQPANLLLLNGNPIDNLDNLANIDLVINKGIPIQPDTLIKLSPEALVQQQLDAYNAHNLEAFLSTYSDSVEVFILPHKRVCYGKDQMRKVYDFLNHSPNLHCQILNRIVQGNYIIDQEHITGIAEVIDGTVIYEVKEGKIRSVYLTL
jgi:imidazolonepropionase-like amidohydrolase